MRERDTEIGDPVHAGSRPVRIVVWEVLVIGLGVKAWRSGCPLRRDCRWPGLPIFFIAVAVHVVGPQRVDRHQIHVWRGGFGAVVAIAATPRSVSLPQSGSASSGLRLA